MKKYNPKNKKNRKKIREGKKLRKNNNNQNILKIKNENKYLNNIIKDDKDFEKNKIENVSNEKIIKEDQKQNQNINFLITVDYDKKFNEISSDAVIWDISNTFFPDAIKDIDFLKYYGVSLIEKLKENKAFIKADEAFLYTTNMYNGKYIFFISTPDMEGKKRPSNEDVLNYKKIYHNILEEAKYNNIKKIVINNIRMRKRLLDIETATDLFIREVINFVLQNPNTISEIVILTDFDDEYTYITKYIKENYYNSYNFIKKDIKNINENSVIWQDRKRSIKGSYPNYSTEILNIFDKFIKYNVFPVKDKSVLNISDIKSGINKDPINYISNKLNEKENIDTKDILIYLEYIYNKEKNHDGIIASEIKNGNLKKVLEELLDKKRN